MYVLNIFLDHQMFFCLLEEIKGMKTNLGPGIIENIKSYQIQQKQILRGASQVF